MQAIERTELDQQLKLVQEFSGHVIECVFDQNGNHVIQKCIECIPYDGVRFMIISFFGQVKALSSHPYGCRVIQVIDKIIYLIFLLSFYTVLITIHEYRGFWRTALIPTPIQL